MLLLTRHHQTLVLSSNLSWNVPGASPSLSLAFTTSMQRWTVDMLYFTQGCLVAFVVSSVLSITILPPILHTEPPPGRPQGIYPTLIIILVALDKSEIEKQSLAYSIPVARALHPSPGGVRIDSEDDTDDAPRGYRAGGVRPHSVILIGPPSSLSRSSTQLSDATSENFAERAKAES